MALYCILIGQSRNINIYWAIPINIVKKLSVMRCKIIPFVVSQKEYVTSIMELSDESQNLQLTVPEKALLISITLASPGE